MKEKTVYCVEADKNHEIHIRKLIVEPEPFSLSPICVMEHNEEIKIFFKPKQIRFDAKKIIDVLNGLFYNGNCSGFDIDRLLNGDIRVYFNPTYHNKHDRLRAIYKIAETFEVIEIEEED